MQIINLSQAMLCPVMNGVVTKLYNQCRSPLYDVGDIAAILRPWKPIMWRNDHSLWAFRFPPTSADEDTQVCLRTDCKPGHLMSNLESEVALIDKLNKLMEAVTPMPLDEISLDLIDATIPFFSPADMPLMATKQHLLITHVHQIHKVQAVSDADIAAMGHVDTLGWKNYIIKTFGHAYWDENPSGIMYTFKPVEVPFPYVKSEKQMMIIHSVIGETDMETANSLLNNNHGSGLAYRIL